MDLDTIMLREVSWSEKNWEPYVGYKIEIHRHTQQHSGYHKEGQWGK